MPDEPDMTSTPCDAPSVARAQITLIETLRRCGIWNDECDRAAVVYVRAMVDAGRDEEAISKELRNLGLSTKGVIKLIHDEQLARHMRTAGIAGTD